MTASLRLADATAALKERLSPGAFAHCERVAETAAALASTYGVNAEDARLAGLLHDWDRDLSDAALLSSAESLGLVDAEVERTVPYLLHAKTGAAAVAAAFPDLPATIVRAIANHTLASPEMSDLDKVVYLADMLEPARVHQPLTELREMVGKVSLGEFFVLGYASSLRHLIESRKLIHPDTVAVWNALVIADA